MLLTLGESGVKVTLAVILDGRGQASGCYITRVDMSSNAASLDDWNFAAMGWPDRFNRDPGYDIVEPLKFLLLYLEGEQMADLMILLIPCRLSFISIRITAAILDILSELRSWLDCPDAVFY